MMHFRRIVCGLVSIVVLAGGVALGAQEQTGPALPGTMQNPDLTVQTLSRLSVQGTMIVDESGQERVLRGVFAHNNTWGYWNWPESEARQARGDYPMWYFRNFASLNFGARDLVALKDSGADLVIFDVNHELFSIENPLRELNRTRLVQTIDAINQAGLYAVLGFNMAPGLDLCNGAIEGAKAPDQRLKSIFEDPRLARLHLDNMLYVIPSLKDKKGVMGYLMIDEPICPSAQEGGIQAMTRTYNMLARGIRSTGSTQIILAQGYNCRELNPGETYKIQDAQGNWVSRKDTGEQRYDHTRKLVPLDPDIPNVVYDIHFFDPYDIVADGAKGPIRPRELDRMMAGFIRTAHQELKAPLMCTSYGINRLQPASRRAEWARMIHGLFAKYHLSTALFGFKDTYTGAQAVDNGWGLWKDMVPLDFYQTLEGKATEQGEAGQQVVTSLELSGLQELEVPDKEFLQAMTEYFKAKRR